MTLPVARAPDLQDVVFETSGLQAVELALPQPLPAGRYYWRVIARDTRDPETSWQLPFDELTLDGTRYLGVATFTVP